jgi:hypothetical protein
MPDRNDPPTSGRDTTSSNCQIGKTPRRSAARTSGPWAGQYPIIVATTSLIGHPTHSGENAAATGPAPSRNSHLARLVNAVQKSRRLQSARIRRRQLRLVPSDCT